MNRYQINYKPRKRTRKHYSYKTQVRMCGLSVITLIFLISLGGIQSSSVQAYAKDLLISPMVTSYNLPTATPSATPKPRLKITPKPSDPVRVGLDIIISKIKSYFPEEPTTAIAIFKAESGLNQYAKNWNCYYTKDGVLIPAKQSPTDVSMACKTEADRELAWSSDCGIAQINTPGKVCPEDLFNVDTNLKRARGKYDRSGWNPWMVFIHGTYKRYLDK